MKRKLFSLLTAAAMIISLVPVFPAAGEIEALELGNGRIVLDTDPEGGYDGEYVLIYNPTTSSISVGTGNMSGLIETTVEPYSKPVSETPDSDEPIRIDVDPLIAAENAERPKIDPPSGSKASYNVGDTKTFTISNYSPGPSSLTFKCVAKGDHCYVWTPAQNLNNYYTLDSIDPAYPQMVCDEFESKYEQMRSSFGEHNVGSQGDGRVNLMYYNIDDGFTPGSNTGYVAGYFSSYDFYSNGLPMIHIDTYPCVYYVNTAGEAIYRIANSYNVFCHEYQHLINYSITGGMDTWLNESMSAAAEEICYPGSSVVSRIQSWENYYYSDNDDWLLPPREFAHTPEYDLHNGYSMYGWDNNMTYILPLYAQVSLFSQYLFTHYGNTIFRQITERYNSGGAVSAIASATGMNTPELVKNFRIAVTANDPVSDGGLYGFMPQAGYDPNNYHGVENPYQLLGPVVYTDTVCAISGGGAITVKPVGGNYVPPASASSTLQYVGISRNIHSEPVELEGMMLNPSEADIYEGTSMTLRIVTEPINANDFDVEWTVSDAHILSINASGRTALITGAMRGSASVTAHAVDRETGASFTASSVITVKRMPTLDEALNVTGGTLTFTEDAPYPWAVNTDRAGRVCANSTNAKVSNSTSTIKTVITMQAGETLTFDWSVSSESGYDKLIFFVNNTQETYISGDVGFESYTFTALYNGSYTFKWDYTKDYSLDVGEDTGWLDNVMYSGDPGLDVLIGDVNFDGVVDSVDALMVLRYSLDIEELTPEQLARADVNGDGEVDSVDALTILRISLGIGD